MDLPEDTPHLVPLLTLRPLLKTALVDVVPTRRFTPHDFFGVGFEFCEADGAVAVDFFTVGGVLWG